MSITKRKTKSGTSYIVRYPGFPSKTLYSRAAAEKLEREYRERASEGDYYREAPRTLGEEIDSFLDWKRSAGDLSEAGLEFNERSLSIWHPFRHRLVARLTRREVEDFLADRARQHPRSAANELQVLKAVLRRAEARGQRVGQGLLAIPPIRSTTRTGIALTPEQLDELASFFPEYLCRLPLLAGSVGARLSQWLNLTDDDLDLASGTWTVRARSVGSKSRSEKAIPLTPREVQLFREQLVARAPGTSLVFPRRHGTRFNAENFRWDYFYPAAIAAGLGKRDAEGHYEGITFHDLRHTAISLMCRSGMRVEKVAERVGHVDGGALILKRYRHLYPDESAAAALAMDAMFAEAGAREVGEA